MDSPSTNPASTTGSTTSSCLTPSSIDEAPKVKFLCSFLGSILPRPQDGKLRYVGGETRIVSLPRDISYEELMIRMRELYEGAAVLKYQQPDEDLDALVSVVNDDDVTNMMEEYEKLGSGDGFTRLRIFLFSQPDQDGSAHYVEGDERDTERRYVDALNNLNDGSDFRKPESPVIGPVDDMHVAEQFFNTMSIDGSLHNQRNGDMSMPQYNLRQLTIPSMGSVQHQQPVNQRYNEMDGSWSPAYYSPRHHGHHDPRSLVDFPTSPSSARYRMPFGEFPDRMAEEYSRQQISHHPTYDHQPQLSDNVVWMQAGTISGDRAGFPGNILHGTGVLEANGVCEHCRVPFHRNQTHLEQPSVPNGLAHVANPCADCPPTRETIVLNANGKLHHGISPVFNDAHSHERGRVLPHPHVEEARTQISGVGRLNDHYTVDGPGISLPFGHRSLVDGHHIPSNYVHHRAGHEIGNDIFHDQAITGTSHLQISPPEERVLRYGNFPYAYGTENIYPLSHGPVHHQPFWRNVQNPTLGAPYEASSSSQTVNGTVNPALFRGIVDGSKRYSVGGDNQNLWVESSQKMQGFDGPGAQEYSYSRSSKLNLYNHGQENQNLVIPDPIRAPADMLNLASSTEAVQFKQISTTPTVVAEANHMENVVSSDMAGLSCPQQNKIAANIHEGASLKSIHSDCSPPAEKVSGDVELDDDDPSAPPDSSKLSVNRLSFLPQLIASVKKAALENVEEVKAGVEETDNTNEERVKDEATVDASESPSVHEETERDSDNDNINPSKIEPTKAEAEAIARGLQTIKNADLEEIRELGSGTYGAVYHGKWKGSDVAIKRIKASCFAGRPSERERLIADFWKEALILSSLHHPNVVSFYGIVRDGPDGSLATVTEFMVNGSLKQFLQKKDRTIDRRKRLIIAMDAAFGMEYLHGKNIVHFDLKCENLLVNMRDPQRPVCKIGDLGLSKVRQHTLVSGGVRGTLPWMAPELLSGKSNMVTEKIDVYSFGIVMWELLTGDEPYADMHCASIIGGIVNNTLRPQIPSWCDPEWKSLMESCWSSDPAQRPSFSEISQRLRIMAAAMNLK